MPSLLRSFFRRHLMGIDDDKPSVMISTSGLKAAEQLNDETKAFRGGMQRLRENSPDPLRDFANSVRSAREKRC